MPIPADVLVAEELSSEGAAELAHEFMTVGLAAQLRVVPPRRSAGDLAWVVLALLPLQPFLDQLGKDVAADAYQRLKSLSGAVFRGRSHAAAERPKVLLLQDSTTGVQIVLEQNLPDDAYEDLLAFDLTTIHRGPLHYDRHGRRWRSELDEASDTGSQPSR